MRPGKATLLVLALALAGPVAAHATGGGPVDAELDEIVVVATKRATSIRDVAADVTVITAAELQATLGYLPCRRISVCARCDAAIVGFEVWHGRHYDSRYWR